MEIFQSGGIIGLSMDKRILGYQEFERESNGRDDFPLETEYISNLEKKEFLGTGTVRIGRAFGDMEDRVIGWDEIEEGGVVNPRMSEYHLKHFMSQIVHVMVAAQKHNYPVDRALGQLCIGSDYDGLINPVWFCETTGGLPRFQKEFEKRFPNYLKSCDLDVNPNVDVKAFSQKLFFENGRDFVLNRLDLLNA